jgi:hypothetical protein
LFESNRPVSPEPESSYSPVRRALGVGLFGAAAYSSQRYLLDKYPGYGSRLYHYAKRAEDLSPGSILRTFRLSERFSSYTIPEVHIPHSALVDTWGRSTPLASHLQRLLGPEIDITAQYGGMHFQRLRSSDPYLRLVGNEAYGVRFADHGVLTKSSFRYDQPLYDRRVSFNFEGDWWRPSRLRRNFQKLRLSQFPRGYKSPIEFQGRKIAPLYGERAGEGLKNLSGKSSRFLFEWMERPQRLLAEIGFGLKAGSYNKLINVPFFGEGGMVNQVLLKRVLPVIAGVTALRYADYLTGHTVSNFGASLPLRANVLRADLTDSVPGARKVTDFYSQVVPGAQYGPLALPAAGAVAGALLHYGKVLGGRYPTEAARSAGSRLFPNVAALRRWAASGDRSLGQTAKALWKSLGTPGKGALVGLAAMLPFIPGMLGSRQTGGELRRVYSGEEPVAVRAGRWWDLGSSPYEGQRIKEYRPHWYQLFKSRAQTKSLYGSEEEYWARNPILHPIRYLRDPYYLEEKHYEDRPYPVASPAFSNIPLIGPLLAATVGKLIKPPRRMHEDEWRGDEYSLYSPRLEPKGDAGLPPPFPRDEFGLKNVLDNETTIFSEWVGLPGYISRTVFSKLFPDNDIGQEVYFQGSRQMTNFSRQYYERELGAGVGPGPGGESLFGYTEPFRRFVQRETGIAQANEIPNTMPGWLPGDDYFINFRVGDPYVKISSGYARLPGAGYEALHPGLEGIDPEDYPDIEKLRILGDVAPYSREFAMYRGRLSKQAQKNTDVAIQFEQIIERVRKLKDSVVRTSERRFTEDTETVSGTIQSASPQGIQLEEYPGRTFTFSSLGMSAADLSALALSEQNDLNRTQLAKAVDQRRTSLASYFSNVLPGGTNVRLTIPKGGTSLESSRAVVEADGENVNQALLSEGLARFQKDNGGAEASAMYGILGRTVGALSESLAFTGDNSVVNPLRFIPTPGHTKLWQERTALAQYEEQEAVGSRMRRWDRPIDDFLGVYTRGAIKRLTGERILSPMTERKRELNTLSDMLRYLRSLQHAGDGDENRGRYTSQARRTAIGANLFGSPTYIASTLPDRESHYFRRFLNESDPAKRAQILEVVSPEMAKALSAQWAAQAARIARAEGRTVSDPGEEGYLYDQDELKDYGRSGSGLGFADYERSKEIAEFFSESGFSLPGRDAAIWDDAVDYEDVKLKIIQNEGYDMHDFNIFEDRAALLWRKPWIDGAVRELTSTDSRSVENLRQAVEKLMLAAQEKNPDARTTGIAASRAVSQVRVDVDLDEDEALLRDMRRNPENYDLQ